MNIEEFAAKIGVSVATVSRAMTGRGRISPTTREMILRKMDELGYTPNLNARRLAIGRSFFAALTLIGYRDIIDLFTMELGMSIMQSLKKRKYDLLINPIADSAEDYEVVLDRVKSRSIDGTILFGFDISEKFILDIARPYHPCVVLAKMARALPHVSVVAPTFNVGCFEVAQMLSGYGHKSIGFIDSGWKDDVLQLFDVELSKLGIKLNDNYVKVIGENVSNAADALRQLMSLKYPPTAIFARTDLIALEALHETRNMGIKVPDDLSIIGHDDLPLVTLADPPLTTVHLDRNEMGEQATAALFNMFDNPDKIYEPKAVHTSLILRESVRRLN